MVFELDGEFRQEISKDLDGLQGILRELADNLDTVIDEARTLEDSSLMEESMKICPTTRRTTRSMQSTSKKRCVRTRSPSIPLKRTAVVKVIHVEGSSMGDLQGD